MTITDRALGAYINREGASKAFHDYEHLEGAVGWTLRMEDEIIGCAGLLPMWPGVMQAWLLPSPLLPRYPRTVVEALIVNLQRLIADRGLRRVQCTVQKEFLAGRRLVEWLGFEPEGLAIAYGPQGEDHVHYAWINPTWVRR